MTSHNTCYRTLRITGRPPSHFPFADHFTFSAGSSSLLFFFGVRSPFGFFFAITRTLLPPFYVRGRRPRKLLRRTILRGKLMPVDPTALPWWGWLLCGVVGVVIALIAAFYASAADFADFHHAADWTVWFVGMVAGLSGLIAFAIGLVRFVKWAWG